MKRRYPPRRQRWKQEQQEEGAGEGACVEGDGDEDVSTEELVVWTSTMLRTGQTVAPMTLHREVRPRLGVKKKRRKQKKRRICEESGFFGTRNSVRTQSCKGDTKGADRAVMVLFLVRVLS